jgi:hypothetical protein
VKKLNRGPNVLQTRSDWIGSIFVMRETFHISRALLIYIVNGLFLNKRAFIPIEKYS